MIQREWGEGGWGWGLGGIKGKIARYSLFLKQVLLLLSVGFYGVLR